MSKMYTNKSDNLVPVLSTTGAAAPAAANPLDGYTLAAGTWYVELGSSEGPGTEAWCSAFAMSWNAAFAAAITLQSTCYPSTIQGTGLGVDVRSWDAVTNRWFPESPATANVLSAGGGSNAYAAPTYTAGGAALGGFLTYLPQAFARRYRLAIVVGTVGTLRTAWIGKD